MVKRRLKGDPRLNSSLVLSSATSYFLATPTLRALHVHIYTRCKSTCVKGRGDVKSNK